MIWSRIKEILIGYELHHVPENESLKINHLLTDSRLLKSSFGTLFFAISGKQNGHNYIEELYQKGVRFFIVEEELKISAYPEGSFLKVENSVGSLQAIAQYRGDIAGLKDYFKQHGKVESVMIASGLMFGTSWIQKMP